MADLQGKRILVVGGDTALGRKLAVGLAEAGADVAIAALSPSADAEFAVNSALNELWALGRQGIALAIDASSADDVREAVQRAERELGRLDLGVAVAGDETSVALDALRAALAGREIVLLPADSAATECVRLVVEKL